MRLSDLLGSEVIAESGHKIGRIHEVRGVQDGPLQDAFGAALRIEGVIVGRGSIGTRLGFDRTDVKAPAAVRFIIESLVGRRLYVPWERITAIQEHCINISGSAADLEPPAQLSSSEQVDLGSPP
jgi:sporulation protein YlmC with PRC-barrel domain